MKGLPKKGFMNVVHCEENEAMNDCLLNLVDHFLLVLVAYLPDMLKFILSDWFNLAFCQLFSSFSFSSCLPWLMKQLEHLTTSMMIPSFSIIFIIPIFPIFIVSIATPSVFIVFTFRFFPSIVFISQFFLFNLSLSFISILIIFIFKFFLSTFYPFRLFISLLFIFRSFLFGSFLFQLFTFIVFIFISFEFIAVPFLYVISIVRAWFFARFITFFSSLPLPAIVEVSQLTSLFLNLFIISFIQLLSFWNCYLYSSYLMLEGSIVKQVFLLQLS